MSRHAIHLLLRETLGDPKFRKRWEEIAPLTNDVSQADVVVVDQFVKVDDEFVRKYPRLHYVVSPTTGTTHITHTFRCLTNLTLKGEVEFLREVRAVSEMVFYYILKHFRINSHPQRSVQNKTIAIIGLGRIGRHVMEIAKAFQMNVLYWDRGQDITALKTFLMTSDVITVHLSETSETKNLLNKDMLSLIRPEALFINTARESIVDEEFLYEMAFGDKISLALDVSSKDITTSRIMRTLHIAGSTLEARIATDQFMADKLKRLLQSP